MNTRAYAGEAYPAYASAAGRASGKLPHFLGHGYRFCEQSSREWVVLRLVRKYLGY